MTLILSCATQEYVVQVSDRRLVTLPDGQLRDDDTNKAVVFCGRMVFAYTGLAKLENNEGTDVWLTKVLSDPSCRSLSDAVNTIRTRATETFQEIPLSAERKRHTFVGIGWTRNSLEEPFRPIICAISNYEDEQGNISSRARDEFTNRIFILQESDTFDFLSTRQQLPANFKTELVRNVRRCVKRQCGPQPITRLLAVGIRKVAVDNKNVGDNLLAVSFPKSAIGSPDFLMVSGSPLIDVPSFLYIPAHQTDGIEYGPNVACKGWGMTEFRITPAGRR